MIKLKSGKIVERNACDTKVKFMNQIDDYYAGDEICFIGGTNFAYIIPKNKDSEIKCVMCGAMLPQENDVCDHCGHGLVKYR